MKIKLYLIVAAFTLAIMINACTLGADQDAYSDPMQENATAAAEELSSPVAGDEVSAPFGVAFGEGSSNQENFMDFIHELGVSRTKVSFFWHKLETEDDSYNWKEVDEYLDQLQPGDKALLNVFTTGWCTNNEAFKGSTFKNEVCKEKYREFIVDLVEHTQGKITYWQRDTEPASYKHYPADRFEEYVEAQKIFYEAVKSVQPDAIVIGVNANGQFIGGEHSSAGFFDYVIHYGEDYFDLLDIRLYQDKYDISMRVEWFRSKMKQYGYEKPIVCTEFGGPDPREFPEQFQSLSKVLRPIYDSGDIYGAFAKFDSMREEGLVPPEIDMFLVNTSPELEEKRNRIHCRDLVQRHLIILSSEVKELWYWNLQSSGVHPIFGKMRLVDPEDWNKLPPYYCYQRMVQQIGDIKTVERIFLEDEDVYLFQLTINGGDIKYVIWERRDMFYGEDQPATPFELVTRWNKAKITDVFGNEAVRYAIDGVVTLDITGTPLYIEDEETFQINDTQIFVEETTEEPLVGCGNGICEEGENIATCQQDCFVSGFTGNNFGGDLLWYGVHEWKTNPETLNAFQNLFDEVGMEIARFDIYWGKLEPADDTYDWTLTDDLLNIIDNDIPVLFTIFSTSEWGSQYNNCRELISEHYGNEDDPQIYNRPPSSIPINMQDYMDFLDVLVNRYKDRVQYWMIENEVHSAKNYDISGCPLVSHFWIGTKEEYVDLLENSYLKIKQADPDATVMATNYMKCKGNEEFTDYIFENSGNYSDVLALNLYGCPEEDIDRIIEMKAKMNSVGYDMPIWVTEHGEIDIVCHPEAIFQESFNSPEELKLQSEEIVKRQVLAFLSGVKKIFRLTLNHQNEEWNAAGRFLHMGLTFDTAGKEKKPGFYTNKLLIEKFKNFSSIEKIDYGIYRFGFSGKDPVYVLWSDSGIATIDLSSYVSTENVKITHIITELDSNGHPIYPSDQIMPADSITVDETPIFVEETE